jgi:hypothetical protein
MKHLVLIISIITLVSGCTFLRDLRQTTGKLDKDHFKQTMTITDETYNPIVTFSTILGTQNQLNAQKMVSDDNFLRGFLDKRTGKKIYQAYSVVYYGGPGSGAGWKLFYQANYETPTGTKLASITTLKKEENCSSLEIYGKCVYTEHLSFKVDETFLRDLVKDHKPEEVWQYYLLPKTGQADSNTVLVAEIAGLLERIDEYMIPMNSQKTKWESTLPDPLLAPEPQLEHGRWDESP